MRYEWYVVGYDNGNEVKRSPNAMTRGEADNLRDLLSMQHGRISFKVKHLSQLKDKRSG